MFSVDLFNEGVDVPDVDTVLMLRPTESPTLFLQQLGRGLRKANDKAFCTVLDFVGTHRKEFRFDRRYRALLGGTRRDLERAVAAAASRSSRPAATCSSTGSPKIVLRSLRDAIPTRWPAKVDELRSLRRERPDIGLADFLDESGLDLDDVYDGNRGAGPTCAKPQAHRCFRPARTRRSCAERSVACSTSTISERMSTFTAAAR